MSEAVAVILAAGMGSRLAPLSDDIPKGLVELDGRPLVLHSVDRLRRAGLRRIRVVTGYLADRFAARLGAEPDLELVENPDYGQSGSLRSLVVGLAGLERVAVPVLILESDLVYEARAVPLLLGNVTQILTSAPTGAGDEVHVWADAVPGRLPQLRALSKDPDHLAGPRHGELTGLNAVAAADLGRFIKVCRRLQAAAPSSDYEAAMVAAAREMPFGCRLVDDLFWAEIDDARMLARVRESVWPEITRRDRATAA